MIQGDSREAAGGRSHTVSKIGFLCKPGAISTLILIILAFGLPAAAQRSSLSDGVFTSAQALRGKAAFDMDCSRCHNLALTGSERGPAIKGPEFLTHWEKDNLTGLFTKIRDTMPQGNSGNVKDEVKIDILSYILQQNGFPEGNGELKTDIASLEDIRVKKDADASGPANFSLVQAVGCLTLARNSKWILTNASDPVATKEEDSTPAALEAARAKPLGAQVLELVSVSPPLKADSRQNQKVEVRGLLYRDPKYVEVNLTSLETLATSCTN